MNFTRFRRGCCETVRSPSLRFDKRERKNDFNILHLVEKMIQLGDGNVVARESLLITRPHGATMKARRALFDYEIRDVRDISQCS